MMVEISTSEKIRSARGSALKSARKQAGLSAERLAQFVNERTAGSAITKHAIYSYEQGKVLLSREVGHRIATALQLHPGQLLLGDPEYTPAAPGTPGSIHSAATDELRLDQSADRLPIDTALGVPVAVRVELVVAAQKTLAPAEVLVRLLGKAKLGRIDIAGYLDVFHLLLEETLPLIRSAALQEIQDFGDQPGNENPYALTTAIAQLHALAESTLKRLIDPTHESPTAIYDYCETQTRELAAALKSIRGEIDACNKRLPGVSLDQD
ncbi:MAG: helix-turn-helix transcriptional regulator [Planctomycetota bacterium]